MKISDKPLVSLDEIALIPTIRSYVNSRKEVYPFDENGKLPIFVAPMTCIIDKYNYDLFNSKSYAIRPVRPDSFKNNENLSDGWLACPFDVFKNLINNAADKKKYYNGNYFICVDMANGHMRVLYDYVKMFKQYFPNSKIMIGNIANPETYVECCLSGVDYVRVGIGGGSGCTTSVYTGFHNSLVNMLETTTFLKQEFKKGHFGSQYTLTKVVADGGIDSIGKAIKCLALGADYVMMGKLFAQCEESAAKKYNVSSINDLRLIVKNDFLTVSKDLLKKFDAISNRSSYLKEIWVKEYYGQASEQGQIDRFGMVKSTPEGITTFIPMEYTYDEFMQLFENYLRSAMSYNSSFNLEDFIGNVNYQIQTIAEFNLYNK